MFHFLIDLFFAMIGNCQISCLDSLSVGKPMVALSLTMVPGENGGLVLAMGGLDKNIHIYCGDLKGKVSRKASNFVYTPSN